MGRYLELAKSLNTTKPSIQPTVPGARHCEISEISEISLTVADGHQSPITERTLGVLVRIHAEHEHRLQGRSIARVLVGDWRRASGLDEVRFRRILLELESTSQIVREHGYARPKP